MGSELDLLDIANETEMFLRECMLVVIRLDTNMNQDQARKRLRADFAKLQPVPTELYR